MIRAYLYYPVVIGLAIWMAIKDVHIVYGIALLIFVGINDPFLRLLRKRLKRGIKKSRDKNNG